MGRLARVVLSCPESDARRLCQIVSTTAMPAILRTLDSYCTNTVIAELGLIILLQVTKVAEDAASLLHVAGPVSRTLDAHVWNDGVAKMGLNVLLILATTPPNKVRLSPPSPFH